MVIAGQGTYEWGAVDLDDMEVFGNMMGQTVKEIRNIDNGQVLLNASGLTAGIYFAKLSNEQGEYAVQKIVVR